MPASFPLYINAGNTHVGILDPGKNPGRVFLYSHREFFAGFEEFAGDRKVLASSVVPEVKDFLKEKGAFIVSPELEMPFSFPEKMNKKTLGADRLCNGAGLLTGKLPALSLDFGTAVTLELITEEKMFYSGGILPGRKLMRQALNDHTALLPLIPLDLPVPPGAAFTTEDSLVLGTDLALVGAVKELIRHLQKAFSLPDGALRLVGCGGDRRFFLPYFPEMEDDGFLTYKGLQKIGEENGL